MLNTLFGKSAVEQASAGVGQIVPPVAPKPAPVAVAEPVAVDVVPTVIDHDLLAKHAALSAKLGVHSDAGQQLKLAEWETFLTDSGLRVYDEKQVAPYLTSKYGAEQKGNDGESVPTWGWRPLREADAWRPQMPTMSDDRGWVVMGGWSRLVSSSRNGEIQHSATTYRKPIPIPVLLTVERVVEKFPDARFFVSDEFHPREFVKDPFLMVLHLGKHYIIERWDEPNYRER